MMDNKVDSYQFIGGITARTIKTWVKMESPKAVSAPRVAGIECDGPIELDTF